MKLLLIAPPSAHRNEVAAFLAQRGAEVELRSAVHPSALRAPGAVDAVVVLDGGGRVGDQPDPRPADVPVIWWPRGGGMVAGAGLGARPASPLVPAGPSTPSASGLQELAFRVAQAAHGTASADASPGDARRSYRPRAGFAAGADAA